MGELIFNIEKMILILKGAITLPVHNAVYLDTVESLSQYKRIYANMLLIHILLHV